MSILAEIIKKQEEDFYLRNTSYLVHIPAQTFREELTKLYNHTELTSRALATLLNAIYTDGKPTFFLSMRSIEALFDGDKNLNFGSRKGIKTTEYRQAAAQLLNFLKESQSFQVVAESSKEYKTPACVALINQETLLSMGDGMMMKLASNWHEMAMKQLWNLRKCHEITEQSGKSSHDKDKDKDKVLTGEQNNGIINSLSLGTVKHSAADVTPESILVTWKPVGKINYKELDQILSDLFTTLKYYSFPKDELSTKKILRIMFGPSPSKDIQWLVDKAEQSIEEQRELIYAPSLQMQIGLTKTPGNMKEDVDFDRFAYIMSKKQGEKNV